MNIVMTADRNMEVGLHVTLATTLRSLEAHVIPTFHLFLYDFNAEKIELIRRTQKMCRRDADIRFYNLREMDLGKGRAFHKSMVPYAVLRVPSILPCRRFIYLDCDLIVLIDIGSLIHYVDGCMLAAVSGASLGGCWEAERSIYLSEGLDLSQSHFNTGVVVFDCEVWRELDCTQKSFELVGRYGPLLRAPDQTILNIVAAGRIARLPPSCNVMLDPGGPARSGAGDTRQIIHLLGAPKPWDLCGEWVNAHAGLFASYLPLTACAGYRSWWPLTGQRVARAVGLGRSYGKVLRRRLGAGREVRIC